MNETKRAQPWAASAHASKGEGIAFKVTLPGSESVVCTEWNRSVLEIQCRPVTRQPEHTTVCGSVTRVGTLGSQAEEERGPPDPGDGTPSPAPDPLPLMGVDIGQMSKTR